MKEVIDDFVKFCETHKIKGFAVCIKDDGRSTMISHDISDVETLGNIDINREIILMRVRQIFSVPPPEVSKIIKPRIV